LSEGLLLDRTSVSQKRHPSFCGHCGSVAQVHKHRWDNIMAVLRACCTDDGRWREDVAEVVACSPGRLVMYDAPVMSRYMQSTGFVAMTESAAVGIPLQVVAGQVDPNECGVYVERLGRPQQWLGLQSLCHGGQAAVEFVEDWARQIRLNAAKHGGFVVPVVFDEMGAELLQEGPRNVDPATAASLTDVIALIGGPTGMEEDVRDSLCMVLEHATQEDVVWIGLPGGKQHSAVVVCDVLQQNTRGNVVAELLRIRQFVSEARASGIPSRREAVEAALQRYRSLAEQLQTSVYARAPPQLAKHKRAGKKPGEQRIPDVPVWDVIPRPQVRAALRPT